MKKMKLLWLVVPVVLILYVLGTLHTRHQKVDGQMMTAQYVQLPGWSATYYPEDVVDLSPWVGSNVKNLKVQVNGEDNPELQAAAMFKSSGFYGDEYEEKLIDGHWVLYRPARTERYFTLTANYRVTPFKLVKE